MAQVEKVESLGAAKAGKWGALAQHTPTVLIWEYPHWACSKTLKKLIS